MCLSLFLLNGCGNSEFVLDKKEAGERRTEQISIPYFFSRSADILGGSHFIPPERHTYREISVERVPEEQARNHNFFEQGRRNITVNAIELVWKEGASADFWKEIAEAQDIHTLTINAKIVKILSPLRVPGADVVINAETLEVGPRGFVDITPGFREGRPEQEGEAGRDGESAGRIVLNVGELNNRGAEEPVFIARGGQGQSGHFGRPGKDGTSVPTLSKGGLIYQEKVECYEVKRNSNGILMRRTKKSHRQQRLWRLQDFRCHIVKKEGRMKWPEDGEDAVEGGRPGNSGDGGTIITDIALKNSEVDLSPGNPGESTPGHRGGAAGTPQTAYARVRNSYAPNGGGVRSLTRRTREGKDAPPLKADILVGEAGRVLPLKQKPGAWMSPNYRKMLQWYGEDNYLAHSFERAEEIYRESLKFYGENDTESRLFVLNARLQLQKMYSHRNIFFRPAAEIPGVYFYRNNSVVVREIEWAMELLYRVRGALKGYKNAQEILVDWASRERERGWQDFYNVLEQGRVLAEKNSNSSLSSLASGEACQEKLFKPVSFQMFSSLDVREEEGNTYPVESLLEMSVVSADSGGNDLYLWSQGRRPRQPIEKEVASCKKINLEMGEWIVQNRVRKNVFKGLAMEAVEVYLSIHKKIFKGENPSTGELGELEREIKKILLKHYRDAVKSYQYYHLVSWQGFFPWEAIVSKADALLEHSEGDWRDLTTFYWQELEKIFRPKSSSFLTGTLSIRLNKGQLAQLRKGRLYLNLLDSRKFYRGRKGVKIQNIELRLESEGEGEYELSVTHPGRFYIQKDEKTYYVEMPAPKVWKTEGLFQGGGVSWKRGQAVSPLLEEDFVNIFEHDAPTAPLVGGLTQLIVESPRGGALLSRVVLHISYRYHP